ncbi:MAG: 23S rRNA (guanosine(2251)-2'-O)-methyltransferase RlmB [bacterium]
MSEIIFGINPITETLVAGKRTINKILVAKNTHERRMLNIVRLAREARIPVIYTDKRKLEKFAPGMKHQGVVATVSPVQYASVEEIITLAAKKGKSSFICLLDGITDPHNLGAIIRSAEVLGAGGVVITKHHSCPITGIVEKASAGALEHIPVARVHNMVQFMEELKKKEFWVIGADSEGEPSYKVDLSGPVAIVIGSEGKGLRPLVRKNCDNLVSIPMSGKVESLNASCAASIIMYEISRQMKGVDKQ